MTPGLLQAPVALLGAAATSARRPAAPGGGRPAETAGPAAEAAVATPVPPLLVVAGAPGAARSALVATLLGDAAPPAAPPGTGFLLHRHGTYPQALAYVPGSRVPRRLDVDSGADPGADPGPGADAGPGRGRPPRRVELFHPAPVLREVSVLAAAGPLDSAGTEIVLGAAEPAGALVLVTDAAEPLDEEELAFLAEAARRGLRVALVLAGADRHPDWPERLAAGHRQLAGRIPELLVEWVVPDPDPDALRARLVALVPAAAPPAAAARRGVPAVTVAADATAESWREPLERAVQAARSAAVERLAGDLAAIHTRGVHRLAAGDGCARLPHRLDRELHALSVRTTRHLDAAASEIIAAVFADVLDAAPDAEAERRIRAATRRALADAADGAAEERILLLTATCGVATVAGPGAVAGLAATPAPAEPPLLPAIGIALTSGCYAAWQQSESEAKRDCRQWLHRAVRVVDVELQREVVQRFADLQEALAGIASDAVDHGVLLA